MEQTTLLIILIDALLVALIALIVLLYLNWRKKMRCHAALERLFEDVKERQALRSERIVACLTGQYKLDRPLAEELAEALFSAEKLFLTQFIEVQMQQQSVEGFYQNLCDLLDSYLHAVPESLGHAGEAILPPVDDNDAPAPMDSMDSMEPVQEAKDKKLPPPPDWGDVFD